MAIAIVQRLTVNQQYVSNNFASNVTTGNSLVLGVTGFTTSGATISTSAPSFNGVGTGAAQGPVRQSASGNGVYASEWLLPNVTGGVKGACNVTVTNSGTATAVGVDWLEVSGLGTSPSWDTTVGVTNRGTTGTSITSTASGTMTTSPELIYAVAVDFGNTITAVGGAWTEATGGADCRNAYQVATSAGSFTYATTASGSADWVVILGGIQGTGGGGTPANVTGVGAAVTVAGGVGTPAGAANVTGVGAAVTVAGGVGTPAGAANATGVAAAVSIAGGVGTPKGAANVTGTGAQATVGGGVGTPAGAANVGGVGAAVLVSGGVGTPAGGGAANVVGVAAQVIVAGGAGTPAAGANAQGVAAAVAVLGGAGTLAGAANVTGAPGHVQVVGGAGTFSGSGSYPITIDPELLSGMASNASLYGGTVQNANTYGGSASNSNLYGGSAQ